MEGIDRKALSDIFPFNFKVGRDMTLLEVSPKLAAVSPKMVVGSKALDCLQFERPILKKYSFDNLLNYQKATVEVKLDDIQDVNFVGQIVQNQISQQEIIFLVKPLIVSSLYKPRLLNVLPNMNNQPAKGRSNSLKNYAQKQ